ncbi:hypothetical protein F511_00823 [Dorcoceras hygrometricum]|nr:hypothetical protein F511_00823 [Dorcoceras hygrometricum]
MGTQEKISSPLLLSANLLLVSLGYCVSWQHSSSNVRCFENERQALLKFRDELVDEYGRLSSWGVGRNRRECCQWIGVHCHNRTNHVTQLNMRGPYELYLYAPIRMAPLKGKMSPSLLELKHLTYLDLSCNNFGYSNIPEFIGSFEELRYLNLSRSSFSKSIPPSVGNLSRLIYLDLGWNAVLTSENLDWVSHLGSLKHLDLSGVWLPHASTWLLAISKLSSIEELHMEECQLRDIRPSSLPPINASAPLAILDLSSNPSIRSRAFQWFFNFSKSLTFIDFSHNNITSLDFAYAFDKQESLSDLDLSGNALEYGIPDFFGNMSNLVYMKLSGNSITVQLSELMVNLSGPLEKKLQYLDLSDNMISGPLPNFSSFSFLNQLDLHGNNLSDSISDGFLTIPHLIHLDLSSNRLTGTIPDLAFSPFLERLYLNDNMFNGHLRESIGHFSKMEDLVLRSNNLQGVVTESHFFNLSRLQILDLSSNSLLTVNCSPHWVPPFQLKAIRLAGCNTGQRFPRWLQFQRKLEFLDISNSQIAETIPNWLGRLTSRIMHLNASNNHIHGALPYTFFNHTRGSLSPLQKILSRAVVDLSSNKIIGQPAFLCHNEDWELIDISDNLFSGHLRECFVNSTSLRYLNLANNHFTGEIPDSFGSLSSLSLLNLRNNSFSGGIPMSLRNCKRLKMIDLGENRLTGNIPIWIGDSLSSLIVLSLSSNEFSGLTPWSMCNLQSLQVLDASSNMISGPIPKCLYNLTSIAKEAGYISTSYIYTISSIGHFTDTWYDSLRDGAHIVWKGKQVKYVKGLLLVKLIDLSDNLLHGEIPSEITKLDGLVTLNLSRNVLHGQIPQNISRLRYLNSLDLSRNHLSGSIPVGISELSSLGVLDLSYNNLSGRIPPHFLSFDESAYAGNPGLCGYPILNKSCPGDRNETNQQDPNFENDNDAMNNLEHEDKFITRGFYICMVFGFITGFWMIFGTIILSKSARFAYFTLLNTVADFVYLRVELSKARLRRCFQS